MATKQMQTEIPDEAAGVGATTVTAEPPASGATATYLGADYKPLPPNLNPNVKVGMSFGLALAWLKAGHRVARTGWNGRNMWLELQVPDEHSKMRRPYIFMSPVDGQLVPWVASQTDMLADDWLVASHVAGPEVAPPADELIPPRTD